MGKPKSIKPEEVERSVMCDCMRWVGIYPDSWGDHHHKECSKYKTEKFPCLFYEEDGLNAWIPAPDNINNIIVVEDQMEENEIIEIRFKRFDMTGYSDHQAHREVLVEN